MGTFKIQKMPHPTSISHLFAIPTAFPVASNQSKWMREVWIGGTAAWLAAAALPRTCEFLIIFSCIFMNKNVISYLLLVQSGPFHCSSLISYAFLCIGMQEEVRGTTAAGDAEKCDEIRQFVTTTITISFTSPFLLQSPCRRRVVDGC